MIFFIIFLVFGTMCIFAIVGIIHVIDVIAKSGTPPPNALTDDDIFVSFERWIAHWEASGQLDSALAAQVRALIATERTEVEDDAPVAAAQPHAPAAAAITGAAEAAALAAPAEAPVQPVASAPILHQTPSDSAALVTPTDAVLKDGLPSADEADVPTKRYARRSLGAALLALGTRRTLLFLGAFLLVMSSTTLVIFNWASLPPLFQLTIIAGTAAILWASGSWLSRRTELVAAGQNLQLVAALLIPVLGFALGRPGLLNLDLLNTWRLSSGLSLVVYSVAAWRTGRPIYSGAAAFMALSLGFALTNAWTMAAQLTLALGVSAALLGSARALTHGTQPTLAAGPRWVALIGGSMLVLASLNLTMSMLLMETLHPSHSVVLAASILFLLVAYWHEQQRGWLWVALALGPWVVYPLSEALELEPAFFALSMSIVALTYLGLSLWGERAHEPAATPSLLIALGVAVYTLTLAFDDSANAQLALPALILLSGALPVLLSRGFFHKQAAFHDLLGVTGLVAAVLLGAWWVDLWLELTSLDLGVRGLVVMAWAALCFGAAHQGREHIRGSYVQSFRSVGAALLVLGWGFTLMGDRVIFGSLVATLVWSGQALVHRRWWWASASLFTTVITSLAVLDRVAATHFASLLPIVSLALAALYSLGGAALRRGSWRYWTWPGVIGGSIMAVLALASAWELPETNPALMLVLFGLAASLGAHAALWRQATLGYPAAFLIANGIWVGGLQGFFTGWEPSDGGLGHIIWIGSLGLALLGEGIRRLDRAYAKPYEFMALLLLLSAPLGIGFSAQHAMYVFGAMTVLYGLGLWRYRLSILLTATFVSMDLALVAGIAWLYPSDSSTGIGLVIMGAVIVQALFSAWARLRPGLLATARMWGYVGAGLGGVAALALEGPHQSMLALVCGGLAGLLLLLAWLEQHEFPAWAGLVLGLSGAWLGLNSAGYRVDWAAAWLVLGLVGLVWLGWLARRRSDMQIYQRPSRWVALGAALVLSAVAGGWSLSWQPLTLALVHLTLLLASLAVVERKLGYAYAAGAAFVGATLSQFGAWGMSQPQWYVIPTGIYLMVVADGLRRFQGQRVASQVIEAAAVVLLLGVTFGQLVRAENEAWAATLLFGEALLVIAYGALVRLRTPFIGGVGFFVAGVLWISFIMIGSVNQWVFLGLVGLLMVAAYVILERHQERVARAGKRWVEALQHWG